MTILPAIVLAASMALPGAGSREAPPDRPAKVEQVRRTSPRPDTGRILIGRASWVHAGLGSRYLAARLPKGTRLRVCGPLACIVGTVNDYGPSRRVFPGRVVDLSRARFARVCGSPELLGTCRVRVQVLRG